METALLLMQIVAVLAIGVVSPGPSFILVAQTAASRSRTHAVAAAFGMAFGATILAIAALLGLHALLTQVPVAFRLIKVLGGFYLLYLGINCWRNAMHPLESPATKDRKGDEYLAHFLRALAVMVTNPKAAVQYGIIFAAILPPSPGFTLVVALPFAVFALEASWYIAVALALSAPGPRSIYLTAKPTIDRITGVVLCLLAIKLIFAAK